MKKTAAVAVVGGGVIGASVAYHLARRGVRDVVIVDRNPGPGGGSTGRATGGFRAQFDTAINVRLSLLAREELRRFRHDTGTDPGYDPIGYLWLATSAAELDTLLAALRVQHDTGLTEAVEANNDDVASLNPALERAEIIGGTFCGSDGSIHPVQLLRGYLTAAERAGVRTEWEADVRAMERDSNGKVHKLRTSRGDIVVDAIVNCSGAWAESVAAMAGVSLPVSPLRRQVAVTEPRASLPARMPMTIFAGDGFHLRVRDGRALLLLPSPGVRDDPFATSVEDDWVTDVTALARARVPALRDVSVDRGACYAGLYEMSPDKHAIVGRAPECENMFLVNGSSGHGVMHAPALGRLAAELICGEPTSIDVAPLRPTRFAEGALNKSSSLL